MLIAAYILVASESISSCDGWVIYLFLLYDRMQRKYQLDMRKCFLSQQSTMHSLAHVTSNAMSSRQEAELPMFLLHCLNRVFYRPVTKHGKQMAE
jgi:hypothetical protein